MATIDLANLPGRTFGTGNGTDILGTEQIIVNNSGSAADVTVNTLKSYIIDGGSVNVLDYGAIGDGITNDTTSIQNAINTGKPVYFPPNKVFLHTTTLTVSTTNQVLYGPGYIRTSGAINSVTITGDCYGVELNLTFSSPAQTSGYAVYITNANRIKISRLHIIDAFGALYVEKANVVVVDWMYAALRGPGIKWYGSDALRSDVLQLNFAIMSVSSTQYGLDWDGNCHSLEIKYLGLVSGKGTIIRNTSGGSTFPAIGRFGHIEQDYSTSNGIEITAGLDFDFLMPYVLGSQGDGLKISNTINSYEVRVNGGKFVGNTGYGINNLGGVLLYGASTALYSNTLGEINGTIWTKSSMFVVDPTFYTTMLSDIPAVVFDSNDFLSYNRTTNSFVFLINATAPLSFSETTLTFGPNITTIAGGTNPSFNIGTGSLIAGSGAFSALSSTTTGKVGTTFGVGNATPAVTGIGITFPTSQTLSTDLNTFDDYRELTFTATATGMTTSPTGVSSAVRVGNCVTLEIPAVSGTSNDTTFTLTGMPSVIRPAATRTVICRVQDNTGAISIGIAEISSAGVISLFKDVAGSSFTSSGIKSTAVCTVTYQV